MQCAWAHVAAAHIPGDHLPPTQTATEQYGQQGASLSLGSLITLSMAAAARSIQAASTAGLVDSSPSPLKAAVLRVLGRWCPDALQSALWPEDARAVALEWVC